MKWKYFYGFLDDKIKYKKDTAERTREITKISIKSYNTGYGKYGII